jgi:hypothetical protein
MASTTQPMLVALAAGSLGLTVACVLVACLRMKPRNEPEVVSPAPSQGSIEGKAVLDRAAVATTKTAVLTEEQVSTFLRDGVLVVPGVLTVDEVEACRAGLHAHLFEVAGVDHQDLHATAGGLRSLSSTHGSGGVLDVFYPAFKLQLAEHPKLFGAVSELWAASFASAVHPDFRHRYGPFNPARGYAYIDRVCFRVPDDVAHLHAADPNAPPAVAAAATVAVLLAPASPSAGGDMAHAPAAASPPPPAPLPLGKNAQKRRRPLQRSLTPHLDCCPADYHLPIQGGKVVRKWRPIQALVALTGGQVEPQMGGFEAAKGFHLEFETWAKQRAAHSNGGSSSGKSSSSGGSTKGVSGSAGGMRVGFGQATKAAPCVGEYTPIRPHEDAAVLRRVAHVPCNAGDLVLWDNRIPHANSFRHLGSEAREAVFLGFLPDVPLNQAYARAQLAAWRRGVPPNDQWVEPTRAPALQQPPPGQVNASGRHGGEGEALKNEEGAYAFSSLGRKLMAVDPWNA